MSRQIFSSKIKEFRHCNKPCFRIVIWSNSHFNTVGLTNWIFFIWPPSTILKRHCRTPLVLLTVVSCEVWIHKSKVLGGIAHHSHVAWRDSTIRRMLFSFWELKRTKNQIKQIWDLDLVRMSCRLISIHYLGAELWLRGKRCKESQIQVPASIAKRMK